MDQPSPTTDTPPPVPVTTSLTARVLNVFAAPGEVFDEVAAARTTVSNWVAPAVIAAVVGVVATLILFSQPTLLRQIHEQQERAMQKQVEAGKMTQQQADQALEAMQKFSGPMMKISGSVGAVVMSFARLFWWGLVLWLIGRWFLGAPIPYLKAMEVAGLASMITVLNGIVGLLLAMIFGKMFASANLALFVEEFDMTNRLHYLLGAVNLFNFWLVAVMGLGLARLTGASFGRATLILLGYWVLMSLLLIAVGLGQFAL